MKKVLELNHLDTQPDKTKCKKHNHKSKLQQDEHYTCGNHNTTTEASELYDSQILSFADYLKVFSLQLLFAYFEILIPSKKKRINYKIRLTN